MSPSSSSPSKDNRTYLESLGKLKPKSNLPPVFDRFNAVDNARALAYSENPKLVQFYIALTSLLCLTEIILIALPNSLRDSQPWEQQPENYANPLNESEALKLTPLYFAKFGIKSNFLS